MNNEMLFEKETYDKLINFLTTGLSKGVNGDSLTVESINDGILVAIKVRMAKDVDIEKETEIFFHHYGKAYWSTHHFKYPDHYSYCCGYEKVFEFYPIDSKRKYKIEKGYDEIKMGLILLHGLKTKNEETIEEMFKMFKELEKDDVESC